MGLLGRRVARDARPTLLAAPGLAPGTSGGWGQEGGSRSLSLHGDVEKEGKAQTGPQEPCLAGRLPVPDRAPGAALLCQSCFLCASCFHQPEPH